MSHIRAEPATGESVEDKTLGELVALASRDISHLIQSEVELAKAEITADIKRGGIGGGLLGGAGFFAYIALLFLSVTAALAIGLVLPVVVGFAIIGGAYLLLAAVLGLAGISNFKKLHKARLTKKSVHDNMALLKRGEEEPAQPQPQR